MNVCIFSNRHEKYRCLHVCLLIFPFNSPQACGEFGSCGFVVSDASTTMSVTRTVFRTRTLYVIIWNYMDRAWLIFFIFKRQCRQSKLVKIRLKQTVLDDALFLNCSMLSGVSEFPTCHLRQYVQILHKLNNNQITYLELPKIPR